MKKFMIHLLVYISTAAAAVLSIIQAGKQILPWYTFRTILTTLPAFLINVAYTVYNGVITIRNIGAADALVSMVTLQAAMFASFQDKNSLNTNQTNAITGLSVCILISILGISMIWYAWKKKKES